MKSFFGRFVTLFGKTGLDKAGMLSGFAIALLIGLMLCAGSVKTAAAQDVSVGVVIGGPCAAYVGPVGFYNPACGYWTGAVWDRGWYARGHGGYGHGHWDSADRNHGARNHLRNAGHRIRHPFAHHQHDSMQGHK